MFGWLAHALASVRSCADATGWTISRASVRMSGTELAAQLPLLGGVLYLPACRSARAMRDIAPGWLVAREDLAPLLHTEELRASSMIGADGPREWIDCLDAAGTFCARLHLLPDTDYLAWDALLSGGTLLPAAPVCPGEVACKAAIAELLCFRTHRLASLRVLDTGALGWLSPLGRGIARDVARAAAVELMSGAGG
ncbi:hypothetical protein SAMN04487785_105318 [Dyella jiangningensis]|uniref:hypothetical protein n=1 Tax=Dyella sp. AtDHG13 TaxID=1938897 RepID=UPI00088950F9|nr:hypothetical protein [Dyella sp. AtDHG13]PXV52326.1 hypothetical protein BDW41_12047 [Dyella sp. AtDHG13]SDK14876.1 hypothetical protein SAMN04487785_105318 [Dyella jiangningensis]